MTETIAVLGLGKMGSAMVRRLERSGFAVTVWNRTAAKAQALGVGRVADTPAGAVQDVDVALSSLTGPEAVRQVYLGPGGVVEAASGQLFVEMSTAGPDVLVEVEAALRARGSPLVDAPVLGSVDAVERGGLLVLAGGDSADIERARPVLEALGEVRHAGGLGSGARLKLVANSMLGVVNVAGAELLAAGQRAGLDREVVFSVLATLVPGLEVRRRGYVAGAHSPAMFALRDMVKDLDLGLGLFHGAGALVPLTAVVRELVAEVALREPELDLSAVADRYAGARPAAPGGQGQPGAGQRPG